MPKGQLYINKKDAYTEWGISMESTALSALMTPAPNKSLIENDSRLEHGTQIIGYVTKTDSEGKSTTESTVKKDKREVTVIFNISAHNEAEFVQRYWSFCAELDKGTLDIETSFLKGVVFHMVYLSCSQFSEYMLGIGKFTLRLVEPNPKNRT